MLSVVDLCEIDPPVQKGLFDPGAFLQLLEICCWKTTLWGSCLACSKEWWPCFLCLGRKNERGFQGLWHGRHIKDSNDLMHSTSVLSSRGKQEQLMNRKTKSFILLTLTTVKLWFCFNQDIWCCCMHCLKYPTYQSSLFPREFYLR